MKYFLSTSLLFLLIYIPVFAITPEEVLKTTAEQSQSYDFKTGPGSLFTSIVKAMDLNNGSISRRIGEKGPEYLIDTDFTKLKTKPLFLHNADGNFILYSNQYNKFAVKINYNDYRAMFPLILFRFEVLQTVLDESKNLPILQFETINRDGNSYYAIQLDISESEKCKDALLPEFVELNPSVIELMIGTKDFFVYEWTTFFENGLEDRYTLHDVELFPAGTLPEEDFSVPEDYKRLSANSHEEKNEIFARSGSSKASKAVKDVKKSFSGFFKSIGTFCIESPWLACTIFVAIGIILIVTMLCIRQFRQSK